MLDKINVEYPAIIYKKRSFFVANCIMFNLFAIGKTESEAVKNLEKSMNELLEEFNICIIPIPESQYAKFI